MGSLSRSALAALASLLLVGGAACSGGDLQERGGGRDSDGAVDSGGDGDAEEGGDASDGGDAAEDGGDAEADADPDPDGDGESLTAAIELVTREHRFVPGAMFGGWGPHLGHLVRADRAGGGGTDLYWVDDLCSQEVPGDCDVNVDRRVGVLQREAGGWRQIATVALPAGVQQNTAALAAGRTIRVYGMDVLAGQVVECSVDAGGGGAACAAVPIPVGPSANYIGAALSPTGSRVVWWTNVVDGGGGSFSYIVDYGGGWNGPRQGPVGGYNDCAYVNVGFQPGGPGVTFFGQVVSGLAPAWTFGTLVGEASLATTDAVVWANALGPASGDPVVSTDDLWVDPETGDAHLLARTEGGSAAYYHRPSGGAWSAALFVEPRTYRARWVEATGLVAMVTGPSGDGLRVRPVPRAALVAGAPLDLAAAPAHDVALPDELGPAIGLYPVADVYQSAPPADALELVVVGQALQNEAHFVELRLE